MKKKIAIISDFPIEPGKPRGGIENSVSILVEGLSQTVDVHIISCGKNKGEVEKRRNYTIHWLGYDLLLPGFIAYWTIRRYNVSRILSKISPDLVHFHGAYGLSLGCDYPYVCTTHGFLELDTALSGKWYSKIASKIVSLVENKARIDCKNHIIINNYVLDVIGKYLKGNKFIIPNPVDSIHLQSKIETESKNILCIGRISHQKNTLDAIRVFKEISSKYQNLNMVIIGSSSSSSYFDLCKDYIFTNELQDRVTFVGELTKCEINNLFADSLCLVSFSRRENAPMVVSEALCSGVPVLCVNDFGMKYMIENDYNGYKFSRGEINLAANKMSKMIEEPDYLHRLRENAIKSRRLYCSSIVTKETLKAYEYIISHD
ncbi:glycosyltransferase family 4 protein [Vibrio natriegens]|uniref:glycosyltransferase family 4 protein n=1 Tax=Vibrio natriegens TaxID=691 RepID=UPI003B5B8AED